MSEASDIVIVAYKKPYRTFCVTVDRERKGDDGITGDEIDKLIHSGHSGIIAKRQGVVVGFCFYKHQSRTSGDRRRKTLWITRISVLPLAGNDDAVISSALMANLKSKAIKEKISVAALLPIGSCYEMGAEASAFTVCDKQTKGDIPVVRVESGRGVRTEGTKNRIQKYFQGK